MRSRKTWPDSSSTLAAYGMLTLTMVFWAGNYIVGRWAGGTIPPITLTFLRWTGAALLLLPFAWSALRTDAPIIRQNFKVLLLLSISGAGLFNTLQYIALNHTTAVNAGIINSAAPIMIVVANFLIHRQAITTRQLLGIAISTLGVLCVMCQGSVAALFEFSMGKGDIILLVAIGMWAYYSVILIRRPKISFLSFAFVTYAIAAVLNGVLAPFEIAHGAQINWSFDVAMAVIYTATLPSLVAYIFYNRGVEVLGANRAGPTLHLIPFFTIILATTLLGEHFVLYHAVGLALILLGVYVATTNSSIEKVERA